LKRGRTSPFSSKRSSRLSCPSAAASSWTPRSGRGRGALLARGRECAASSTGTDAIARARAALALLGASLRRAGFGGLDAVLARSRPDRISRTSRLLVQLDEAGGFLFPADSRWACT
jgi:hypothetical protein